MSRILTAYATVKLELVIPDEMEDQQAIDELFFATQVTLEETENVEIQEVEMIDLSTESMFEEDVEEEEEEDLDAQYRRNFKGYIE